MAHRRERVTDLRRDIQHGSAQGFASGILRAVDHRDRSGLARLLHGGYASADVLARDSESPGDDGADESSPLGLAAFLAAAARQVRPYWREMTLVCLASVPEVALETVQPMLLMVLIDAIVARDTTQVWLAVLGLVGLIPIYIAGNFLGGYLAARVGASVCNDLRLAVFWRLHALSVSYLRGRSRGDLLSRMSSDLDAVERAVVTDTPSPCPAC